MRIQPKGYRIHETIYASSATLVVRAERECDQRPVVLKILQRGMATPAAIARYHHEFEILSGLRIPGVIQVLELETLGGAPMLVLEDFGGQSLARLYREQRPALEQVLVLALRITELLGQVHDHDIIHGDLNPANILLDQDTGEVKLADFGGSTRFPTPATAGRQGKWMSGTLAYMSPEQTGRMSRPVDYRTDFYSLGVTLYELCTGRLPFATGDALELVHSHLAREPVPPHELDAGIPAAVSDIVIKLMAKMPKDRYQSARGCARDLEECKRQLDTCGTIERFVLGQHDYTERFQIPSRLYGREQENAAMRQAFARAAAGARQLVLVAGYPGIGKSALVHDLGGSVAGDRGRFLEGKHDQYHRNIPYSALAQAFGVLVRQLLTEPEDRLEGWRRALQGALGASAGVLIEVIPELAFLLGPQPAAPRLGPTETENRLSHAFRRFVEVLCREEGPLVVFLDDLQWADAASLRLMKLMLTDPAVGHLLIIGAYRDGEVDAAHPLRTTLDQLHAEGMDIEHISLGPLGLDHVRQLLVDTLRRSAEDCAELAELVLSKTGGNPFFVSQFLLTLHHDRLLAFDRARRGWRWKIEAVRTLGITDNVVDLMVARIRKLPAAGQRVLPLAAGVGNTFELTTLAIICEDLLATIEDQLASAVDMGLIRPLAAGTHAFAHDRVQQAAYALIPEDDKPALHLRIARLLERALPPKARDARVFELAEHFARGAALIDGADERRMATRLCLAAGRRAKESMAHESARRFLRAGLGLMPEGSWRDHYELMRDLVMAAVETEYLSADVDAARQLSDEILENARDVLDKVAVRELQIFFHMARHQPREALEIGLDALSMLGVELPREPAAIAAREQALREQLELDAAGVAALEYLPELADRHQIAIIRMLNRTDTSAFYLDIRLWNIMRFIEMVLFMRHGQSSVAASTYAVHAGHLCADHRNLELGSCFGMLAVRLVERLPDPATEVKAMCMFYSCVHPWSRSMREAVGPLRALVQRGLQTGDLEFAAYSALWCCFFRFYAGDPLDEVQREQRAHLALLERYGVAGARGMLSVWARLTRELLGQPESMDDPAVLNVPVILMFECFGRAVLHYIMGDHQAALEAAERGQQYEFPKLALPINAEQNCFLSLAALAVLPALVGDPAGDPDRARDLLDKVERNQEAMRAWAERVPENFAHKHALVEAERARVRGELLAAMALYDDAIRAARTHGYVREEALACERAAGLYGGLGREHIADMYLHEAYLAYRRWGAQAKVNLLEEQHPWLAQHRVGSAEPASQRSRSSSGAAKALDLESVVRASQALSSQLVLDELLAELMKLIVENAGAQRGYLLLTGEGDHAGTSTLQAEGDIDTGRFRALPSLALDHPRAKLARTALSYVSRTRTSLVLGDASEQEPHARDPYVRARRPRSLLCAPVTRHGALVGIIYLENNRAADAFTPDRVEVVQMLAAQAAISIENARLLGNLERAREEAERAREQAERASRAKSEFLANINHELRTPMNGIIGTIELLQGSEVNAEQRDYLTVARTAAEQLMRIIRDTLDVSRIEAGKVELEPIHFSLDESLATLTRMLSLRPDAQEGERARASAGASIHTESHGLCFSLEVAEDVPKHLFGDRDRLLQVLMNLLGNAVKFTPRGGAVSLHVAVASRDADDAALRFEVRDTGIGIAAEAQESIFQPFTQMRAPGLGQGGSGLGLAIAASLVTMMQGNIGVDSAPGQGSRFWFTVRLGVARSETAAAAAEVDAEPARTGLRILVAEDNRINQLVAVRLLNREGHQCAVAENGAEALHVLESEPIDAVLMDVHMPVMDGYAATREIRRREQGSGRHLPIIAVSASATTDVVAACTAAGMDHYLSKPLRIDAVREMLRDVLPGELSAADEDRA